ncbi:hypothetical protein ACS0TY_014573 [Phlomoides rotata]
MEQEPELEEGETCYSRDDADIDPDIALSYIGDKVQSILGHLQKDFEGGVSAENLGAKFGGYGSFLPMHQRSLPILLQQKSPPRVQNPHFPKSPNVCPEGRGPNPVMLSTQRDATSSSPSMHPSQNLKISSSLGASVREKDILASGKVAQAFSGKVELPSSKLDNLPDRRSLKVRIKVGPERASQYNAQIYSLGLTSPSSSEGNSHDESDGLPLDSREAPNESPTYMLKIMTSLPVSDGLLLSPLCEDLLNLAKEREYSVESEHEAAPNKSAVSVKLLNNDVFRGKDTKFVDKRGKFEKSEDNFIDDPKDCDQKTLGGDNLECSMQPFHDLNCKSLPEAVRDSDKDDLIKRRKVSKVRVKGRASVDLVKDASVEHISVQSYGKYEQPESRGSSVEKIEELREKNYQREVSVDHGQDSRSGGKGSRLSFKAYSDHSEGEGVKKALDDSIKAGLNPAISEHNAFYPHAVGRPLDEGRKKLKGGQSSGKKESKEENSRNGDCAAPKRKFSVKKDTHRLRLSQKDAVHTGLEQIENPKRLLERPSSDMPMDFNLDDVKSKSVHTVKLKERSRSKKHFDKVSSATHIVEPPTAAVHSKEGQLNGLKHTVADPVLIQEEWVGCDRCEKWRLLPYGTRSEQLPEKWVCSMLDWLPGMNRCDISEDDTSAALRASYLVPVPENQHSFQPHANGTMAGAFSQNHQNCASDQTKQQKLKEKQNTIIMNHTHPSNGKKQMQQLAMKNGSLKDVKQCLPEINASNKSDMQHPNKSTTVSVKLNKRKGEHAIEDDANPKKKIKESAEYTDRKGEMQRVKSKDALVVDNFQASGGNLGVIGHSVKSGMPSKAALKNGKKKSALKEGISEVPGNVQIYVKKHTDIMEDLPDNEPLGMKTCKGREVTRTKIRLKDNAYSQYQVETGPNNVSNLQDRKKFVNEESKDGEFHRDKRPRVSQVEEEFRRSQGDDISSKRKSADARVLSGSKEHPRARSIEKELLVKQPRIKPRLTIEDIDKLRKDLGCEEMLTAATSSSSKVSGSRKNRLSYVEREGSPVESVSSSPMRMLYPNQASSMMMETAGKVDFSSNDVGVVGSTKKSQDMNGSSQLGAARKGTSGLTIDNDSEIMGSKYKLKKKIAVDDNRHTPKHEVSSNTRHPLSNDSNLKSAKNSASVGKNNLRKSNDSRSEKQSSQREHDKNDLKSIYPCSRDAMQQNVKQDLPRSSLEQAQVTPWNGKVRIDLRQGGKKGALCTNKHASGSLGSLKRSRMDVRPDDASVVGDTSKAQKGTAIACLQNGTETDTSNEPQKSVAPDVSLGNKNVSGVTASTALKAAENVLKEAEELKTHADLIKNSGFSSESNYEYFKAALKFLHGASLLEACNGEPSKHLETRPMQMYGAAAQLCKICANGYDKSQDLAAAALTYKCMEVAYMRIVYFKSSTTSKVWQDLQSSLQMVPQGESPSSSASDVDNLNNLAMADKATLSKGSGSQAGNHVIVPRNRPNFVRLLDFTKDVNSAMEAAKKSQDTFAAAHVELTESQNKDAIVFVKRVIDFSFQDVEEFVRLVWLAFNSINHQGVPGNRD